jgi:hypothetical protein
VEDPVLRTRLIDGLNLQLSDNVKAWILKPDGKYERVKPQEGEPLIRSQAEFIVMTRDRVKSSEAAATSGRFHLLPHARPGERGADGRRGRREVREAKKPAE